MSRATSPAGLSEQKLARAALTYLAEPGAPALGALLGTCEPAEVLAAIKADLLPGIEESDAHGDSSGNATAWLGLHLAGALIVSCADRSPDRTVRPDRHWEWAALRFEDGDFDRPASVDTGRSRPQVPSLDSAWSVLKVITRSWSTC